MPEYSMHINEGNGRQYMTTVLAADAQDALGQVLPRVPVNAKTASIEILEVLEPE